jgi:hypothetical protein
MVSEHCFTKQFLESVFRLISGSQKHYPRFLQLVPIVGFLGFYIEEDSGFIFMKYLIPNIGYAIDKC